MKTVLVTGSAGFIGFHLCMSLLSRGDRVVGIDNLNDYYDPALKSARLAEIENFVNQQDLHNNYRFIKMDICDRKCMEDIFNSESFDVVVNLAAQAGVRYSIENPHAYIESNLVGFLHVLEGCRNTKVEHLVYASSSSVYGMNRRQPFNTTDNVDYPVSLYAATKKSNELMAHTYSHLYNLSTTGLRFFTVYGPWGRPDMAPYKFAKAILQDEPIDVYNKGNMKRDFTYITDIIEGVTRVIDKPAKPQDNSITNAQAPYKLYNIGNNQPITLRRFITAIEAACGHKAKENLLPMQSGDVPITFAEIEELVNDISFKPETEIEVGIEKFVDWLRHYNKL